MAERTRHGAPTMPGASSLVPRDEFQKAQDARRAALNLMEDAVQARQAMDRLNAALRVSEERSRTLVEQVKDYAIFRTDTAGRATSWNEGVKRVLGFDEAEFIGQDIVSAIFTPEDVEAGVPDRELRTAATEGSASNDRWMQRKDGTRFYASGVTTGLKDESGRLAGFSKVMRDTTAHKRTEEERDQLLVSERLARQEAEEANRLKDEFLTTVSHELRTPLNAMLGWLRLLRAGMLDDVKAAHALVIVERNARAQHELVADLLDVSRIMSGKLRFEPRLTALAVVIEAAIEAVRPSAEAKGVELRLALDPAVGPVSGDAARLQQIVWNLLTNAIKYTPPGGHIEARLGGEGTQAVITVEDSGEGISADFLPHVFARFRQADGSTTRRHGGLGVGLALVRYLAEAHGGQVHAASEGAGHGATFTVTLPLIPAPLETEDDAHADADQPVSQSRDSLRGLRVLVVDDQGDARELLSVALTQRGADVKSVATARAALDLLLDGWQPSVLVSDIGMPEQDGYELMNQVRALPAERGGGIPAVAVTGYASLEGQRRALASGYQQFMPKPVDLDELSAAIARLVVKD